MIERKGYCRNGDSQSVSMYFQGEFWKYRATASASHIGDKKWWVNRVFVSEELRGRGFGKGLLLEVLDLIRAQGGSVVHVCPGGYNIPQKQQFAFYRACGFEEIASGEFAIILSQE